MKPDFRLGLLLSALMLLFTAGYCRSQDAPEPPEPPASPDSGLEALQSRLFATTEGGTSLGVTLKDITAQKAQELKLPGEYGALVERVEPDSAAAKAGIEKGDVIVEFGGERVRSVAQLRRLIRETPADRSVSIQVVRDGQSRSLSAKLEPVANRLWVQTPEIHIPEINIPPNNSFRFMFDAGRPNLGISGDELTPQLAGFFGVKQGKGVLVREVVMGSPAAKAGLKAGDIIVAVDGKAVTTVAELRRNLELKPGAETRKLTLTIVRDHHEQPLPVEIERPGLGEREKEEAGLGIDAGELQQMIAQAKAQMDSAGLAVQEAQKQLLDKRLLSDEVRRALEVYRKAIQEQKLSLEIQRLKQLYRESEAI